MINEGNTFFHRKNNYQHISNNFKIKVDQNKNTHTTWLKSWDKSFKHIY